MYNTAIICPAIAMEKQMDKTMGSEMEAGIRLWFIYRLPGQVSKNLSYNKKTCYMSDIYYCRYRSSFAIKLPSPQHHKPDSSSFNLLVLSKE